MMAQSIHQLMVKLWPSYSFDGFCRLDLDAFYVAASRKRDPSLVGLPIGIKQKVSEHVGRIQIRLDLTGC